LTTLQFSGMSMRTFLVAAAYAALGWSGAAALDEECVAGEPCEEGISLLQKRSSYTLQDNTTANSTTGLWGTCGGTAEGSPCKFPFSYNWKEYTQCTDKDHDNVWCYTLSGKWGNCYCHHTCGGTAHNEPCAFPFRYKGHTYATCTPKGHDQPWCYTDSGRWGNCDCGF